MTEFNGEFYGRRLLAERSTYEDCLEVHDLPAIFHYWTNTHVRPKLEKFGFREPEGMFGKYLWEQHELQPGENLSFASVGAGNCDLEISLARFLISRGFAEFSIDCLELNSSMAARGRAAAIEAGVGEQIRVVECDANEWIPACPYDAVIASQSLHHIVNLEGLFARVKATLPPTGVFVISDMIGRNGHLRWPESLAIVREFWRKLPPSYRFNGKLQRFEEIFDDRDCSGEGFEGIRAQDILPLLVAHFHFRLFVGFGNAIDPFVDRAFGNNFDADSPWDRAFIDDVHRRDEDEMLAGRIKPTHMLAVVCRDPVAETRFDAPLSPAFCIRDPSWPPVMPSVAIRENEAYDWSSWPGDNHRELVWAGRRLAEAEARQSKAIAALRDDLTNRTAWAHRLEAELAEKTRWALQLDRERAALTEWARSLEKQLTERTKWALQLNEERLELTEWANRLDREKRQIVEWARGLDAELADKTRWALELDRELRKASIPTASRHFFDRLRDFKRRAFEWIAD